MGRTKRDYATEVDEALENAAATAEVHDGYDARVASELLERMKAQTRRMLADPSIADSTVLSYAKWSGNGPFVRPTMLRLDYPEKPAPFDFVLSSRADDEYDDITHATDYLPDTLDALPEGEATLLRWFHRASVGSCVALAVVLGPGPEEKAESDAESNPHPVPWLETMSAADRSHVICVCRRPWSGAALVDAVERARALSIEESAEAGGRTAAAMRILDGYERMAAITDGMADMIGSSFYSGLHPCDLARAFEAMAPMTVEDASAVDAGDIEDATEFSGYQRAALFSDSDPDWDIYGRPAGWRIRTRRVLVRIRAIDHSDNAMLRDIYALRLAMIRGAAESVVRFMTAATVDLRLVIAPMRHAAVVEGEGDGLGVMDTEFVRLVAQGGPPDSPERAAEARALLDRLYALGARRRPPDEDDDDADVDADDDDSEDER